ncbi:2937_t:CDS:1, partial [Cetraspora pellucida]
KEFETARKCLATAKRAYEEIIAGRSATQREINELLQRKHQWSGDDVIRFTQLYKNEHTNEQIESAAREEFQKCEQKVEQGYTELTRSIMLRYHEEQIWSDKIRSASTYGTVALMMLNVISFI